MVSQYMPLYVCRQVYSRPRDGVYGILQSSGAHQWSQHELSYL